MTISGRCSPVRCVRSRSRSQASARQLRLEKRGGSSGRISGRTRPATAMGTAIGPASARNNDLDAAASAGVSSLAEDSTSSKPIPDVRLVSVAQEGAAVISSSAAGARSPTLPAITRAIKSSASLCRHTCPQRCLEPARSGCASSNRSPAIRPRSPKPRTSDSSASFQLHKRRTILPAESPQTPHSMHPSALAALAGTALLNSSRVWRNR